MNSGEAAGNKKEEDGDHKLSRSASVASIPASSVYADPTKLADVALPLIVHTADLTNSAKPFDLYDQWATRIVTEFFAQGDRERELNLPIGNVCDRHKTDKPTVQTGFINFIIKPWFTFWGRLLTDRDQGPLFLDHIDENFKRMNEELQKKRDRDAAAAEAVLKGENDAKGNGKNSNDAVNNNNKEKKKGNEDDIPDDVSIHTDDGMDVKIDDRLDESKLDAQQQSNQTNGSGASGGGTGSNMKVSNGATGLNDDQNQSKSTRSVSFGVKDENTGHQRGASQSNANRKNRNKYRYKRAQSEKHLVPDKNDNDDSNSLRSKGSGSRSPSSFNILMQNARTEKAISIVAIPFEEIARAQHQQFAEALQMPGGTNVPARDYSNDDSNLELSSTHSQDNVLEDYGSGDDTFDDTNNNSSNNNNINNNGNSNDAAAQQNGVANGNRGGKRSSALQNIPEEPNGNMV